MLTVHRIGSILSLVETGVSIIPSMTGVGFLVSASEQDVLIGLRTEVQLAWCRWLLAKGPIFRD